MTETPNPEKPGKKNGNHVKARARRRGRSRFAARLRGYFLAGVLVTAPVAITVWVALLIINLIDRWITPLIPAKYNPETYLPFGIPGLGLIVLIIVLTLIGALTAGLVGRWIIGIGERILARMPVVNNVYSAVKQIFETVLAKQSRAFREAVLVEYPRRGIWAIGFITGSTEGEVQHVTKEDTVNVFLPTTPNPTSGFLLFVPRTDLVHLDMSVEEAIKMVISGGIVTPPDRRPAAQQAKPVVSAKTYEDVDVLREEENLPVLVEKKKSA